MNAPASAARPKNALPTLAMPSPDCETSLEEQYVSQVIADIINVLRDFAGADVEIGAFSPPRVGDCHPDGMITLRLATPFAEAEIAIDFGSRDADAADEQRHGFDRAAFESDPTNPHACGLVARNLSEAWQIVQGVLHALPPASVRLSFGA